MIMIAVVVGFLCVFFLSSIAGNNDYARLTKDGAVKHEVVAAAGVVVDDDYVDNDDDVHVDRYYLAGKRQFYAYLFLFYFDDEDLTRM